MEGRCIIEPIETVPTYETLADGDSYVTVTVTLR